MSKQKPQPLEQTKADPEVEAAALEAQIASATLALEAQRAKAAEARAAAAVQAAARQKRIEAELLEQKINMFVAAAAKLDHYGMSAEALVSFKRLAGEISFAGRLKQAHAAREHLMQRMLGQTVYRPPYQSWSAMAQAWLILPPEPEQTKTEEQTQKVA